MVRVTGNEQTCASPISHLLNICQTGRGVMSVQGSHEADVLLANLANEQDRHYLSRFAIVLTVFNVMEVVGVGLALKADLVSLNGVG